MSKVVGLLDVHEVAERLGVSEEWVRRLCAQGVLPGFKLYKGARAWYFRESDLESLGYKLERGLPGIGEQAPSQ